MKKYLVSLIVIFGWLNGFANADLVLDRLDTWTLNDWNAEGGNGGDAVVCRNDQGVIQSAELYDFFEGRELGLEAPEMGPAGTNAQEKVEYTLMRFRSFFKDKAEQYRFYNQRLDRETRLLKNITLRDIPSSTRLIHPPRGCEIEQVVVYNETYPAIDERFVVNSEIFSKLDLLNQAGLRLHMLVMWDQKANGLQYGRETTGRVNSLITRYLVAKISSASGPKMQLEKWIKVFRAIGLETVEYDGVEYYLTFLYNGEVKESEIKFYQNDRVSEARVKKITIHGIERKTKDGTSANDVIPTLFYESGRVMQFAVKASYLPTSDMLKFAWAHELVASRSAGEKVLFYDQDSNPLKEMSTSEDPDLIFASDIVEVSCVLYANRYVIRQNGFPSQGSCRNGYVKLDWLGTSAQLSRFYTDEEGLVYSFSTNYNSNYVISRAIGDLSITQANFSLYQDGTPKELGLNANTAKGYEFALQGQLIKFHGTVKLFEGLQIQEGRLSDWVQLKDKRTGSVNAFNQGALITLDKDGLVINDR